MKKIISILTVFVIICSSSLTTSFATNNNDYFDKNMVFSSKNLENDYEIFKFDVDKTIISDFMESEIYSKEDVNKRNSDNILRIMEKINNLEIPDNLKTYYLNELEYLKSQEGILKDYSIYIPKDIISNSGIDTQSYSESSYGNYNGQSFKAGFSVYNRGYDVSTYDSNKIGKWVSGTINLGLNFTPKYISIPATILQSVPGGKKPYAHELKSPHTYLYVSEEVTSRQILMKDFMKKIVVNANQYVTVLADQAKIVSIDSTLYNNNPYAAPKYIGKQGPQQLTTTDFYNSSKIMKKAYDNYVGGSFPSWFPSETIPNGTLQWK